MYVPFALLLIPVRCTKFRQHALSVFVLLSKEPSYTPGRTPLMEAASAGRLRAANVLLSSPAIDVNAQDEVNHMFARLVV